MLRNLLGIFQNESNFARMSWALCFRFLFVLLIFYTILITAWVGDDIQISFRQIWNFINGDGITFNYGERVQAFTHPLWFFVLSAISFMTGELFLTTILTCVVISMLSIMLLLKIEYDTFQGKLPLVSPIFFLIFSWAFIDYSTSGLENALSYLLTGLLLFLICRQQLEKDVKWVYLILALLVLNRFDYAVLFLPLALILIPNTKNFKGFISSVWPGILIIISWLLFATFYFGSPMPNTYYAKLYADYPLEEVLFRGKRYFQALRVDQVSTLIMCTSLILSLLSLNRILISLAIGQAAYMIYIFQIGGDFMQGRFFALPVYLSIGQIVLVLAFKINWRKQLTFKPILIFLGVAITIGLFLGYPFMSGLINYSRKPIFGIFDERSHYYELFGLYSKDRNSWPRIMNQLNETHTEYKVTRGYIGMLSLKDTSYHLIDTSALSDPFLARIPAIRTKNWRIGHHLRKMPLEYGEYLVGNIEELPDKKLNDLLFDVYLAARADLNAPGRLGAIWRLSTNYHKEKINFSEYKDPEIFIPSTLSMEDVKVKDWNNAVVLENLPDLYKNANYEFRRFNNNVRFVSDLPELADGIVVKIDVKHDYDIYVNDNRVERIEVREIPGYYRDMDQHLIRLDEPVMVRSVALKSVGANYEDTPPFNHLSEIKLILNNK